ncbi:GntR family transcriptional regulator [Microbacterium capsulatum]|uniref:GntR family transcriptional regulator n=1 Tax=Microbacterium capsulatum TaxID=3041921 RepID=A0ABU0XGP6_9MICO|nr:GntR family transcriptional regulator [Microbacterium sp. ASV81]MDQ4214307.1 GntR family transcriptional regulator [Microbacterium sp. ASV81]
MAHAYRAEHTVTTDQQEAISSSEQAYLLTREAIIAGDHPSGARLTERVISDALHMSRVPVREALRRLEDEGYIRTYPQRGAVVNQLTLKDAVELYDMRRILEVPAAQQAALAVAEGRASPHLKDALDQAASATLAVDRSEIQLANRSFHAAVAALSGNDLLIKTTAPLLGRFRWLSALSGGADPDVELAEHSGLCEAIYAGNADLAGALAFAHIERGRLSSLPKLALVLPPR